MPPYQNPNYSRNGKDMCVYKEQDIHAHKSEFIFIDPVCLVHNINFATGRDGSTYPSVYLI